MVTVVPEGMIPVADFGRIEGIATETVVKRIREGVYVGLKVGDEWYIEKSQTGSPIQSFSSQGNHKKQEIEVVVTDIEMPFGSMVVFIVKFAIASIPAFIILFILFSIASVLVTEFIGGN